MPPGPGNFYFSKLLLFEESENASTDSFPQMPVMAEDEIKGIARS